MLAFTLSMNIAQNRDRSDKFMAIYTQYSGKMMAVSYSILKNHHDAEEAVQNALFSISKNIDFVPDADTEHAKNYCLKAAKNHAINIANSRKYNCELERISVEDVKASSDMAFCDEDNPILEAICDMKPIYRDILIAKYVYELSVKQIAQLYGLPTQTVKSRLARGVKLIRNSFKEVHRNV